MELISDITTYPFDNLFDNPISNTIDTIEKSVAKNMIDLHIKTDDFIKQFELDKIIIENKKKHDDIKSNIDLLEEVIIELEKKASYILDSIKYIENIHKESIQLFTHITR
jgi:hypothetical protein